MTEEINLYDPIFDDMEMPELAERRTFLGLCRKTFEESGVGKDRPGNRNASFEDWKIYVSLLIQMGIWDVNSNPSIHLLDNNNYANFSKGRLCRLGLCPRKVIRNLLKQIGRLEYLEYLALRNIQGISFQTISMLPRLNYFTTLESLEAHGGYCGGWSTEQVKFSSMTDLRIGGSDAMPILNWCATLKYLWLDYNTKNGIDKLLDILCSPECCFAETLTKLICCPISENCLMDSHQVETLVFEAVPKFPNFRTLWLPQNMSLKVITTHIESKEPCAISKSLQEVSLRSSSYAFAPVNQLRKHGPELRATTKIFLETFKSVQRLDILDFLEHLHGCQDLEYLVIKNSVGRRLLEGNDGVEASLPLSMWPVLLERAEQKISHLDWPCNPGTATGIYYLLRNGPAVIGRRDLTSPSPGDQKGGPRPKKRPCRRNGKNMQCGIP